MEPRTKKAIVVGGTLAIVTGVLAWWATSAHASTGVSPGSQVPPPRQPPPPTIEPSNIDRPVEHAPPGTVPANTERQAETMGPCANGQFKTEADQSQAMDYLNSLDKPEDLRLAATVLRKQGCTKIADYAESRATDIEKSAAGKAAVQHAATYVGDKAKEIFEF